MKQSATHWICDDEEWIEGRLKEIGRSSQDGATSRCISSAKIYGARRYLSIYFNTFQKWESHERATMPPDMQECPVDLDSWAERCLRKDQRRFFPKHQHSSTLERVTQHRAKETPPGIGLAFYRSSIMNNLNLQVRGHSGWQRGSIPRSRSNFWTWSLAYLFGNICGCVW